MVTVEHSPTRRSGRGEARRRAILDAASTVFLQKGYEKASLSEILALSGGSRATIYQAFGSKDGLLEAMMVECCQSILAPLDGATQAGRLPEEVLLDMGRRAADTLLSPASLALLRVMMAEGRKFPHLAQTFQESGQEMWIRPLADYLACIGRGAHYNIQDPVRAARLFFSMAWGDAMFHLSADLPESPTRETIMADVEMAVDIFMQGIRRRN